MSKIYTKTGDKGMTRLATEPLSKASVRIEVCGDLDELSAALGVAKNYAPSLQQNLTEIQKKLSSINAELACADTKKISPQDVANLEQAIDEMTNSLPPLQTFVVPGNNKANAFLHLSRTICRRTERSLIKLNNCCTISNKTILIYLNRLSDWLFTAARIMEQ